MTTITTECEATGWLDWSDEAELVLHSYEISGDRQRWLELRRLGIGGSDAAAVMGVGRFGANALSVWLDKKGRLDGEDGPRDTTFMDLGNLFEAPVAEYWSQRNNMPLRPEGLLRSKHWPHIQVTPDRMAACGGGYEGKYQGPWLAKTWFSNNDVQHGQPIIPLAYRWQGLIGMAVTGADHWHFGSICGQTVIDRTLWLDDPWVGGDDGLVEKCERLEAWWAEYIDGNVAPANDEEDAAVIAATEKDDRVQALIPSMTLMDRMRDEEIANQIDDLKAEQDEIRARVKAEIGNHRVLMVDDYPAFIRVVMPGRRTVKADDVENHPSLQPWQKKALIKVGRPSQQIRRSGKRS